MTTEFIYFDLGNVLLSFSHEKMFRQLAELTGATQDDVRLAIQQPPEQAAHSLQVQYESGQIGAEIYHRRVCRTLQAEVDRDEFFAAAGDIFAAIEESVELVRSLHAAGNRMGILSNTSATDWQFVTSGRFPFLVDYFQAYALSFEALSMKPERRIYEYAAEIVEASPEKVFFTDDKPENVAGARAAGFDALTFVGTNDLREELRRRGVRGA